MRKVMLILVVGAFAAACHTITEELPTRPGPIVVEGAPLAPPAPPTIVIPIPSPTPQIVDNPAPSNPAPAPAPNNPPTQNPNFPPGQVPSNTAPVARLGAKVFFVECDGRQVPNSENATTAQVGYRVHFDVTPKDASNSPTQARQVPRWTFSPAGIAGGVDGKTEFTPTISATGAGTLTAYCEADGIRSNDVRITFR